MTRWVLPIFAAALACSSESAAPMGGASGAASSGSSSPTASGAHDTTGGAGGFSDASSGSQGGGGMRQEGDASGTIGDAGGQASAACASFAAAVCDKLKTCTPFVLGVLYGNAIVCQARLTLSCLPSFAAPGTSATPAKTTACEQSIAALGCPQFLAADWGPACKTDPGTFAVGAPCADDAQCATTFCARAPDAACGICQPSTKAGDPCVRGSCSAGTVCPAGQSTCITPVPGKVGDPCTAEEQCDLAHAVGCNTGSAKCLSLTLASAQGSCGANSIVPTSYAVCPASGTCSALLGGRCSSAAADNASCSTADTGTHCLPPARCVAARCTVVDATSCR